MSQKTDRYVTLEDVLRLALPLSTTMAGGEHPGQVAYWVTVLTELENLEEQIHAGDIVILPVVLQEQCGLEALARIIPRLSELAPAALLTFRPVPAVINEAATGAGLPLIIVSDNVSLREVHQGIAGLLVDRKKQTEERGMQLYRRLTEMSRESQGLVAMTEVMSRLCGKIVALQDKRLELIALTIPRGIQIDETAIRLALVRHDAMPSSLSNRKAAAQSHQSFWHQLLPIGDREMARVISPIVSGDRARGYISVVGPPDELDQLDTITAEQGAAACALEMAKAKAISEAKKALRGNFLEGLLAGRLPESEIQRLAGRLDHDTSCPHAILVFSWDGPDTPSLRRLETPLNWLLSSHSRSSLAHIYSSDHVCVFQALRPDDDDLSTAEKLARRIRDHLRAEFPNTRLVTGMSGPARTLAEWPVVYRQAVQALELAKRLEMDGIVEYENLGIYRLLAGLEGTPAVSAFCDQIVGPLAAYDRQHQSRLVQTINAYFNHHGNISQTAEALYIHRNTLLYRLERIQELTGQDLDQADMRLALHLALKMWQLRPNRKEEDS